MVRFNNKFTKVFVDHDKFKKNILLFFSWLAGNGNFCRKVTDQISEIPQKLQGINAVCIVEDAGKL